MSCPVKRRLKRQAPLLRALKDANPRMRRAMIRAADKDLLLTLSECSLNVLNANQRISPRCRATLQKYKTALRQLAAPSSEVSYARKRRLLEQRGGFLGVLLSSVLGGLLSKLVSG